MAVLVAPTKSNLIKAKSSLELSKKGFELLDKKRNILIKEIMSYVDKARTMHNEIYDVLKEAYESIQEANITLGVKTVEDMSYSVPVNEQYDIILKSVMGVDIPSIKYIEDDGYTPTYGFYRTNDALDKARQKFNEVKYKIYEITELESSIFKLAKEIEKVKKRTNALEHVQIPKFEAQVKYIQNVLEEKEREDFFRLKRLKNKK
ncbi:V-type ATP synthase subunit D [Sedimentibacter sp. MB31-C6]|uniref:V-type ATP synthase subunit D n=1 Tax=Sedimentibacter sp. MB31-C6 TaxID=3109366 RepID=UPI002DDCD820|nr:V-type ATP synthase subunit D [Sedimentibacter sp. MB36-C1]WSI04125.1 V-type ATP synthase subunit D [Sedimentibacter sp. MB36-C1]